uniref:Uncharacterized protein n=1 Tax=Parascaris univalens TaxID=6257 RepID=A0A915BD85_PARUN
MEIDATRGACSLPKRLLSKKKEGGLLNELCYQCLLKLYKRLQLGTASVNRLSWLRPVVRVTVGIDLAKRSAHRRRNAVLVVVEKAECVVDRSARSVSR